MVINTNRKWRYNAIVYTKLFLLFPVNHAGIFHCCYSIPVAVSSKDFFFQETMTA